MLIGPSWAPNFGPLGQTTSCPNSYQIRGPLGLEDGCRNFVVTVTKFVFSNLATLGQSQIRTNPGLALNAHSGNEWSKIPVLSGRLFFCGVSLTSTGTVIMSLKEWGLQIVRFDTTAANSIQFKSYIISIALPYRKSITGGLLSRACTITKQRLPKHLLFLSCCHHMAECCICKHLGSGAVLYDTHYSRSFS